MGLDFGASLMDEVMKALNMSPTQSTTDSCDDAGDSDDDDDDDDTVSGDSDTGSSTSTQTDDQQLDDVDDQDAASPRPLTTFCPVTTLSPVTTFNPIATLGPVTTTTSSNSSSVSLCKASTHLKVFFRKSLSENLAYILAQVCTYESQLSQTVVPMKLRHLSSATFVFQLSRVSCRTCESHLLMFSCKSFLRK